MVGGRAGLVGGWAGGLDAELGDEGGDGGLLLLEGDGADGAGEVFDGEELVAAGDDADAGDVDGGVEEVGAVVRGVHPEVVDLGGAGGFADVLGDGGEGDAGGGAAGGEFGLAGELMGDGGVGGHLAGVCGGGLGEAGVAVELREAEGGALLIGGGEEVLFGDGDGVWGDGTLGEGRCAEGEEREAEGQGWAGGRR